MSNPVGSSPRAARGTIVLFHGLTSSPVELTSLTAALTLEHFVVVTPHLAGHGDITELRATRLERWLEDARQAVLGAQCEDSPLPCFVGGSSFGALLALRMALDQPSSIAGLVMLAPPFRLRRRFDEARLRILAQLAEAIIDTLGVRPKNRTHESRLVLPRDCLTHHSVGSAVRMVQLRSAIFRDLHRLSTPALIVQDPHDHLVDPDGVDPFIEAADHAEVDTIWLPGGEHELTLGPRHPEVSHTVLEFLNRLCRAN